jgi:hypothetical protein
MVNQDRVKVMTRVDLTTDTHYFYALVAGSF